jgi:hypothetical protein
MLKPGVAMIADKSKKLLKRQNTRVPTLGMPSGLVKHHYNIITGD